MSALASPDTGVAEGAGLAALPDNACGVMGLCELLKGHEGKHTTSVDRALEGVVLRATHAASPGAFNDPLDVERLARAIEGHSHVGQPSEVVIACGRGHVERCAPAIAAEYARLTPAPEEAPARSQEGSGR